MKLLSALYKAMQKKELGDRTKVVHEDYYSLFTNFSGSYQITAFWDHYIPKINRPLNVLIIGVYGGRDYYHFTLRGDKVSVMDLHSYPEFPGTRIGNIERDHPFERNSFDIILLSEVIEHLIYDYDALINIKYMLKEDGVLLLSVPYYNDIEVTHIRIHNKISITRLIEAAGFKIIQYRERPGLIEFSKCYALFVHLINFLMYSIIRRTCYNKLFQITSTVDITMSRFKIPWRRLCPHYGAQVVCKLTEQTSPYSSVVDLNREYFKPKL
jgi:SAM-dependent methyltransferase